MIGRLTRDEDGIAMGLAVILIVIVGVMGAGLLVFVRNDLQAVVQVNQGQQAFEAAEAGTQAARRHLLSEGDKESYDGEGDNDSEWSYSKDGKELTFDNRTVSVSIQYLAPASEEHETVDVDHTPEVIEEGDERRFFRVESTGSSESGAARRKVEAIYHTANLNVPNAYYTPQNIEFDGTVDVSGVSFFAGGNIEGSQSGNVSFDRNSPTIYGDWDTTKFKPPSNYNTEPRENTSGNEVDGAGLAAEGVICNGKKCDPGDSVANGIYDYDSTTASRGSKKKFIRKDSPEGTQSSSEISYPFVPSNDINEVFDLAFLREEAQRQGNYEASAVDIGDDNYPSDSTDQTVFFVDAQGATGDLQYNVNTGSDTNKARGIIVIKDGNLSINSSSNGFNGIIIITGDGEDTGFYRSKGNETVEGFVVADGDMILRGSVAPLAAGDFTDRPGFYGVRLWSWRELYE